MLRVDATPGKKTQRLVGTERMRDGAGAPLNEAAAKDARVGTARVRDQQLAPVPIEDDSRRLSTPLEIEVIERMGAVSPLAVASKVRIRLRTWTCSKPPASTPGC